MHDKKIDLDKGDNPFRELEKSNPEEFRKHVENGRRVYYRNCVFCHGDNMSANGMFVHGLDPIPTNFHDTIPLLRETFLFWRISKGGPGLPDEGGPWDTAMPAWEKFLKEEEMWDAILFLYDFTGLEATRQGGGRREMIAAVAHRVHAEACASARQATRAPDRVVLCRVGSRRTPGSPGRRDRCAARGWQEAVPQELFAMPRREGRRRRLRRSAPVPEAAKFHDGEVQDPDDAERGAADAPGPRRRDQARHAVHIHACLAQVLR